MVKIPYRALCPSGVKPKVWAAVIEAWQNGLSDREAAFYATKDSDVQVKESDIKKWLKESRDVADLKDHLQSELLSAAKQNIAEKIKAGDVRTAKWYLERKAADEFSTKAAVAFEGAVVDLTLEEKERATRKFLKQFEGDDGE